MGQAKHEMMRHEDNLVEATQIAIEAGVLGSCPYHPGTVWAITVSAHSNAYKIANARFQARQLKGKYRSLREVTDTIKEAIDAAGMEGICTSCDKLLAD